MNKEELIDKLKSIRAGVNRENYHPLYISINGNQLDYIMLMLNDLITDVDNTLEV